MRLVIYILELLLDELRIHMRGGYIGVTQHFLNILKLRAVFKQMRGKRMTQSMRRNIFYDSGFPGILLNQFPEPLTAHGLSAEVTQLAVSRTRPAGRLHLLTANNPIFLITGERK